MTTELKIIDRAKNEGRTFLTEVESKELLSQIGINTVTTVLATSRDEAVKKSRELGFPVGLKIVSVDIVHKSDAGGVKLNVKTDGEAAKAYDDIIASIKKHAPGASIQGVAVQKMARPGVEVIIGMSKDPQFGPVLMFGLGGIMVEVIKDISLRVAPLTPRDAREMTREIKGYKMLSGFRGLPPVDIATIEDWLLKLSKFVIETPEIKELDLNPIFAYSDGAVAVDARVILEKE